MRGSTPDQMKTYECSYAHPYIFFQNLENSNQKTLSSPSKTLYYQPRVLKFPILLKQVSHKGPN